MFETLFPQPRWLPQSSCWSLRREESTVGITASRKHNTSCIWSIAATSQTVSTLSVTSARLPLLMSFNWGVELRLSHCLHGITVSAPPVESSLVVIQLGLIPLIPQNSASTGIVGAKRKTTKICPGGSRRDQNEGPHQEVREARSRRQPFHPGGGLEQGGVDYRNAGLEVRRVLLPQRGGCAGVMQRFDQPRGALRGTSHLRNGRILVSLEQRKARPRPPKRSLLFLP